MATELDTPIVHTKTANQQRIDSILMNLKDGEIYVTIGEYEDQTSVEPMITDNFTQLFADMPAGAAKDDFRAVVDNVRAYARSIGMLGEGTDTDPIE